MNFDINKVIESSIEIYRAEEEGGSIKYIDYIAILPCSFLNVFTKVQIRIFGGKQIFDSNIQTNLFFYSKNNILRLEDVKDATKQIISIYGRDNTNSGELENYEINNINEFGSWLGRAYDFNQEHRLGCKYHYSKTEV